jgi:hypothetical protein
VNARELRRHDKPPLFIIYATIYTAHILARFFSFKK